LSPAGISVRSMNTEERFDEVVDVLLGEEGVTPPGGKGFGRTALRVHGRIFAMLAGDTLVLKLPKARVDELVAGGAGVRFDANKGTPMKEWLRLDPAAPTDWSGLAREALAYVR
jgi:hypothetical protein